MRASELAIQAKDHWDFSTARRELQVCARATCPNAIQQRCAEWLAAADSSPEISFSDGGKTGLTLTKAEGGRTPTSLDLHIQKHPAAVLVVVGDRRTTVRVGSGAKDFESPLTTLPAGVAVPVHSASDCAPPVRVDADGIRRYKPECLAGANTCSPVSVDAAGIKHYSPLCDDGKAPATCAIPFIVDSEGIRHYRTECLEKH